MRAWTTCGALLAAVALLSGCGDAPGARSGPSIEAAEPAHRAPTERPAPRAAAGGAVTETAAQAGSEPSTPEKVTFTRDVAPIVFENCAPCHRPGEVAPFPLLTYDDARRRARMMAAVTRSRYMPPWMPAPGRGHFIGERRLTDAQIAVIQRWVEQGTPEGDPRDLPPKPEWTEGWRLGEPDLVVEMPEPYTVPAEGFDIFRNFVLPVSIDEPHWIEAVEFRPSNNRVLHHLTMLMDDTGRCREVDEESPEPGFESMESPGARSPMGQLLGWSPGKTPAQGREDVAWLLEPGSDLILELHLLPSGKPEPIGLRIGLFYADEPPERLTTSINLGSSALDIPAGEADYRVTDTYQLPVDIDVVGVYPHTHYLGKSIRAWAVLPEGGKRWLLDIPHWDFFWQDFYLYEEPVHLPAGSQIEAEFVYDNSAQNERNPNRPPERVLYGPRSSDEMCDLWLQVFPSDEGLRAFLERSLTANDTERREEGLKFQVEHHPRDPDAHYLLGKLYHLTDRIPLALEEYRKALALGHPKPADVHNNIGGAYQQMGRVDEAVRHYQEALWAEPGHANASFNLGRTLHLQGRLGEAARYYEQALRTDPHHADAAKNLGILQQQLEQR